MKKLGKILMVGALVATVAAGSAAFTACGDTTYNGDYEGEYKYANPYDATQDGYGVHVKVTVKDNKIVSVTCTDPEGYHNITASWDEGNDGAAAKGLNNYLKKFEGKTVDEIKAIEVAKDDKGAPKAVKDAADTQGDFVYTGATQTSGRIILAMQDALK